MHPVFSQIEAIGIVPVIQIGDASLAQPLAEALISGGVPCAEITFRTEQAADAIRRIAGAYPEVLVGAGTVLTPEQADRALDAGARFAVSPGLNARVVEHCLNIGLPIAPGCATPSDVERALELGLDCVKFFPAEQAGGVAYIQALAAPYSGVRFMPTGGVSPDNLAPYLKCKAVLACGGSYIATPKLMEAGAWAEITALCRKSREIVRQARTQ